MKNSEAKITTILGKGSVVHGDFTVPGSVRIDGCVEGDVNVKGQLIVGATGKVFGNVTAASVIVGGEVNGSVEAKEKVELVSTARLIGDIRTEIIVIDAKAVFQGRCDMNQDEDKTRKHAPKETKAGKKSAKVALQEALKEMEEESEEMDYLESVAANSEEFEA